MTGDELSCLSDAVMVGADSAVVVVALNLVPSAGDKTLSFGAMQE